MIFSSNREGSHNLYSKRADGSGEIERLTESTTPQWATSWSDDGRYAAYVSSEKGFDLWVLPLDGERVELYLSSPFTESDPVFSPGGRFIAYDSNESGRRVVYVRPFPPSGGKWQVSDGSGAHPRWSARRVSTTSRRSSGVHAGW